MISDNFPEGIEIEGDVVSINIPKQVAAIAGGTNFY